MRKHTFRVGANRNLHFEVRSTMKTGNYAVSLFDKAGKRIAHAKGWGPSGCDVLDAAIYYKDPAKAEGLIRFLFMRIDKYVDGPGIADLWLGSTYEGRLQ